MVKTNLIRAALLTSLLFLVASVSSFAQTKKTYIEKMSGWDSCSVCAGAKGKGASVPHTMKQGVASPSMGGKSTEFWVGGSHPYGDALWWKQLGAQPNAHNFTYDLYFYLKNPGVSQSLEFDVNQSVGGHRFVFGTQCDLASHSYEVWSVSTRWTKTGIACSTPAAYKWNHITLQFQRTSANKVKFVSVTINGATHYINRTYNPQTRSSKELNVAFQMDGKHHMTPYSTWVENVSLKYW